MNLREQQVLPRLKGIFFSGTIPSFMTGAAAGRIVGGQAAEAAIG